MLSRIFHNRINSCTACFSASNSFQVATGATIIRKGFHSHIESYSAFWDYAKSYETPLTEYLNARNVTDVYVCGIAIDVCVGKFNREHKIE